MYFFSRWCNFISHQLFSLSDHCKVCFWYISDFSHQHKLHLKVNDCYCLGHLRVSSLLFMSKPVRVLKLKLLSLAGQQTHFYKTRWKLMQWKEIGFLYRYKSLFCSCAIYSSASWLFVWILCFITGHKFITHTHSNRSEQVNAVYW